MWVIHHTKNVLCKINSSNFLPKFSSAKYLHACIHSSKQILGKKFSSAPLPTTSEYIP